MELLKLFAQAQGGMKSREFSRLGQLQGEQSGFSACEDAFLEVSSLPLLQHMMELCASFSPSHSAVVFRRNPPLEQRNEQHSHTVCQEQLLVVPTR